MNKEFFVIVCLAAFCAFGQDEGSSDASYSSMANDQGILRAILDNNGMANVQIDQVATFFEGRIIKLNLNNPTVGTSGLSSLPPEFGQLTELTELSLNDNDLVQLPDEIGKLTKLQKLEIQNNSLMSIPSTIGNLSSIRELDLRNNQLTTLPMEIGLMGKLWKLQLWGNNIKSLPETMGGLSALRELYLRGNRLPTFPASIVKLKLEYMDMQENRLCDVAGSIDIWIKKFDPKYRSWQKCW